MSETTQYGSMGNWS